MYIFFLIFQTLPVFFTGIIILHVWMFSDNSYCLIHKDFLSHLIWNYTSVEKTFSIVNYNWLCNRAEWLSSSLHLYLAVSSTATPKKPRCAATKAFSNKPSRALTLVFLCLYFRWNNCQRHGHTFDKECLWANTWTCSGRRHYVQYSQHYQTVTESRGFNQVLAFFGSPTSPFRISVWTS